MNAWPITSFDPFGTEELPPHNVAEATQTCLSEGRLRQPVLPDSPNLAKD